MLARSVLFELVLCLSAIVSASPTEYNALTELAVLSPWDMTLIPADSCNKLNGHDKEMCLCDNMESPSKKQDQCYLDHATNYSDCLRISRTNQGIYNSCKSKYPPDKQASNDWKKKIETCKKEKEKNKNNKSANDVYNKCAANACQGVSDGNTRDQCWDSINALCYRRSTVEARDRCHMIRKECKEIVTDWRKDDCYSKHPAAEGAPKSRPPPPPPQQGNKPPPQQPNRQCNNDQACYASGMCDQIRGNLDMKDECFLQKKECNRMTQQIAKDYCYACKGECDQISGGSTQSKDWKDACRSRYKPDRCP